MFGPVGFDSEGLAPRCFRRLFEAVRSLEKELGLGVGGWLGFSCVSEQGSLQFEVQGQVSRSSLPDQPLLDLQSAWLLLLYCVSASGRCTLGALPTGAYEPSGLCSVAWAPPQV